jgi:hypothetical protein
LSEYDSERIGEYGGKYIFAVKLPFICILKHADMLNLYNRYIFQKISRKTFDYFLILSYNNNCYGGMQY